MSDVAAGQLDTSNTFASDNPVHDVASGVCPVCDTSAPTYIPPTADFKYTDWHAQIKATYDLTDEAAHAECLRLNGGFIAHCPKCATAYFVRIV